MKEQRTKEHSTNKRNTVAVIALLLACVLAIGGTIAWIGLLVVKSRVLN